MAFGDHDILVIVDVSRDEAMAGIAFPVRAVSTAPGGKTTKLLTTA